MAILRYASIGEFQQVDISAPTKDQAHQEFLEYIAQRLSYTHFRVILQTEHGWVKEGYYSIRVTMDIHPAEDEPYRPIPATGTPVSVGDVPAGN